MGIPTGVAAAVVEVVVDAAADGGDADGFVPDVAAAAADWVG